MKNSLKSKSLFNPKNIAFASLFTVPVFLGILPSVDNAEANNLNEIKEKIINYTTQDIFPSDFSTKRKYISDLKLNTSSEYYTYCFKSQIEGTKDIIRVSKTKDLEESWIFIPEKNLWVETGKKSVSEKNSKSVFSNKPLVNFFIDKYDSLVFYHTHPLFKGFTQKVSREIAIKPSLEDLSYFKHIAKKFYDKHPQGELGYRICSPSGVTEVKLNEEAKNNLEKMAYDYEDIEKKFVKKTRQSEGTVFNFSSKDFIFLFYPWKIE